jgi:hypothetical protein
MPGAVVVSGVLNDATLSVVAFCPAPAVLLLLDAAVVLCALVLLGAQAAVRSVMLLAAMSAAVMIPWRVGMLTLNGALRGSTVAGAKCVATTSIRSVRFIAATWYRLVQPRLASQLVMLVSLGTKMVAATAGLDAC